VKLTVARVKSSRTRRTDSSRAVPATAAQRVPKERAEPEEEDPVR